MSKKKVSAGTTLDLEGESTDTDEIVWVATYAAFRRGKIRALRLAIVKGREKDIQIAEDFTCAWNKEHDPDGKGEYGVKWDANEPKRVRFLEPIQLHAGKALGVLRHIENGKQPIVQGLTGELSA